MSEAKTKPRSKFAAEAQAAAETSRAEASKHILALAVTDAPKNIVRRNMPAMVKPGDVPVDTMISGEIINVVDSPVSTVKGKLLVLRHQSGQEYTFPCTGVIRNALAPGKEGKDLDAALAKEIGKVLYCKRLPDKQSSKYKKNMYMFDVFTSDK